MSEDLNVTHEQRRVPLEQLFLDPNNYRFIHKSSYIKVSEDEVFDGDVQRRTTGVIRIPLERAA